MLVERLKSRLAAQQQAGLLRSPPVFLDGHGDELVFDGKPVVDFGSNDYLGLSQDPRLRTLASQAILQHGTSTCASRLASGSRQLIVDSEQAFAYHFGYESALFFSSGYQANCALLKTLLCAQDHVFFDKRVHASMVDGMRSTAAAFHGFRHSDLDHLERRLHEVPCELPVVLVESLYSMDGDMLDVARLGQLNPQGVTIVDEAHAFGALGEKGRGIARSCATIAVGTFGKAFAFHGAVVLGPRVVRDAMLNFASPFIFTTGTSVAHAVSARQILEIVAAADAQRDRLQALSLSLRDLLRQEGFRVKGQAHILAVQVGDECQASDYASRLLSCGYHVLAARSPTVPQNQAILRLSLSARHVSTQLHGLVDSLCRIRDAYSF